MVCNASLPRRRSGHPEVPEAKSPLEVAIKASYARLPAPTTVDPAALSKLIDTLVKARVEAFGTEDTEADRKHVVMWLVLLSGWASLDSLNHLTRQLAHQNFQICVDGNGATLSDFLLYLHSKKHFDSYYFAHTVENIEGDFEACTSLVNHGAMNRQGHNLLHPDDDTVARCTLLADSMLLRRLRDVPTFLKSVKNAPPLVSKESESRISAYRLIFPFGYEGVNVFNTRLLASPPKVDEWYMKLPAPKRLAAAADVLQLMRAEIEQLTTAQLPEELRDSGVVDVEFVYPDLAFLHGDENAQKKFLTMSAGDLVTHYLLPNFRYAVPSMASWRTIFDMYDGDTDTQLDIASTLSTAGRFYSLSMMSDLCVEIHSQLKARLVETEVDEERVPFDEVFFFIPMQMKSYGLVTMLFFMAFPELSTHNISPEAPRNWQTLRAVVIFDDFAGSGESLLSAAANLAFFSLKKLKWVFLAPLLQSVSAQSRLDQTYWDPKHGKLQSIPGMQLTASDNPKYKEWMGEKGHMGAKYFVAFPHMSPDNNCAFMAFVVAAQLTFGGRGIKRENTPPPKFDRYLEALLRVPHSAASPAFLNFVFNDQRRLASPPVVRAYLCSPLPKDKGKSGGSGPHTARKIPVTVSRKKINEGLKDESLPKEVEEEAEDEDAFATITTPLDSVASAKVGSVFVWLLTSTMALIFAPWNVDDNPLLLGINYEDLSVAEQHHWMRQRRLLPPRAHPEDEAEIYASGVVVVSAAALEFFLHPEHIWSPLSQLEAVLVYLASTNSKRLSVVLKELDMDGGIPYITDPETTMEDFRAACNLSYKVKECAEMWDTDRDGMPNPDDNDLCLTGLDICNN